MKLFIKVKFRAFGIPFGQFEKTVVPPFVIPPIPDLVGRVLVNERGVYLAVVE